MAKLMVKYGKSNKYRPFHPRLKIMETGFSRGHWQEMHFHPGVFLGAGCAPKKNVQQAIEEYFSRLRRMNYVEVKEAPPGF